MLFLPDTGMSPGEFTVFFMEKDLQMTTRIASYNHRKAKARAGGLTWIASLSHHEDENHRVRSTESSSLSGKSDAALCPSTDAGTDKSGGAVVASSSSGVEAAAAQFLKVIILGNAGPQFVLLPLDEECLSLTTKETMSKVLAAKGFPQTGLFVPYLPFHASGGRLDVSMVIKDYISIYFSNTPPTSGERSDFEKCCIGGALPLYIGPNYLACKSYRPLI
jgi:hypothetical protein